MFRVQVSCMICIAATLGVVWSIFSTGKGSLSMYYLYISYRIMCSVQVWKDAWVDLDMYSSLEFITIKAIYVRDWKYIIPTWQKERKVALFRIFYISIYHGHISYRSSISSGKVVLQPYEGESTGQIFFLSPITQLLMKRTHFTFTLFLGLLIPASLATATVEQPWPWKKKTTLEEALIKSWEKAGVMWPCWHLFSLLSHNI